MEKYLYTMFEDDYSEQSDANSVCHDEPELTTMGAFSRNKGCRGEREAADEVARLFGTEAYRGQQYCGVAPDIRTGIDGVHFEVKRCEALRLYKALEQATRDAGDNIPVVLHRSNHKPWVAIVKLEDLPALAVQLYLTLADQ